MKNISQLLIFMLLFSLNANAGDTKKSLELLKSKLNKFGIVKVEGTEKMMVTRGKDAPAEEEVGTMLFGSRKINGKYDVVDDVKKTLGGTATVFVKDTKKGDEFIRISTNVLKDDGTRGIGTTLAHNKAYESIMKGETFCGEVEILGAPYDTCYEPIKDAAGKTVGIYYVGYKK